MGCRRDLEDDHVGSVSHIDIVEGEIEFGVHHSRQPRLKLFVTLAEAAVGEGRADYFVGGVVYAPEEIGCGLAAERGGLLSAEMYLAMRSG